MKRLALAGQPYTPQRVWSYNPSTGGGGGYTTEEKPIIHGLALDAMVYGLELLGLVRRMPNLERLRADPG